VSGRHRPLHATSRVAIVHDALVNTGGAERTLTYMCEAFPDAPVFTSVYLPERTFEAFRHRDVRVLPGARLAVNERRAKQLFPLWVLGFRSLDLSGFEAILSSSTFAAKHIRPPAGVHHACYCYAPFRLLWKPEAYDGASLPISPALNGALALVRPMLCSWDRQVTRRIPALATTCQHMAEEIARCYNRQARVIYVPVRLSDYTLGTGVGNYYLTVSRLMSHKRVDLAVSACQRLGRRLVVVGDGPELTALRRLAGESATFLGKVSDRELAGLYAGCRALLFCSHEDYGLSPIEAQASGRPVIAFGAGGVLETVLEGETGVFFRTQDVDAVVDAIMAFERMTFETAAIRRVAARFDHTRFIDELRGFVGVREAATTKACHDSPGAESADLVPARTERGVK